MFHAVFMNLSRLSIRPGAIQSYIAIGVRLRQHQINAAPQRKQNKKLRYLYNYKLGGIGGNVKNRRIKPTASQTFPVSKEKL
jgi:hypothetical protein